MHIGISDSVGIIYVMFTEMALRDGPGTVTLELKQSTRGFEMRDEQRSPQELLSTQPMDAVVDDLRAGTWETNGNGSRPEEGMTDSESHVGLSPGGAILAVELSQTTHAGSKYYVQTSFGGRHELSIYEEGGAEELSFGFEVDGNLERRGVRATEALAFSAGLDLIRSLEAFRFRGYPPRARHPRHG